MTRETTLGATYRQLQELGYSPTSATHPDRIVSHYAHQKNKADSFLALADHPAAVMCYPTPVNGGSERGQLVALVITAYLLMDPKQSKLVHEVLAEHKVSHGPMRIDDSGDHVYPLQWHGEFPIFDNQHSARLVHDDDDRTVYLACAIEPTQYRQITDDWSRTRNVATEPVRSHVIPCSGEWKNGHILDTPRTKLPELHRANVNALIRAVEKARWNGRPLALAKGAAA